MFNLFNKKTEKTVEKTEKPKNPLRLSDLKPDVAALFNCSVQKTAFEFATQKYNSEGQLTDFTFDSADYDIKNLKSVYRPNLLGQEVIFTHFAKNGFIGFQNCAILAQDWLINKCCALPCEDAISIRYDVTLKDAETTPEDVDVIAKLKSRDEKFKIKAVCKEFAENKRKFGQSLCIPLVKGADYQLPFNIDAVAPGSYRGMVNVEPIWTAPVLDTDATTNPMSKRFYQPTWFRLPNGAQIHYTWFIFNTYADIPDILKPTYFFGGYPLPQLLYEQVYASEKTANEAPMLAQSKRLNYVEGNLAAYVEDTDKMKKEIGLMSWLRNNWGWLFIKKDQRIGQIDTSLTDFDAVTMLGFQLCAAISGVQAARLLETSPKGWQSSGSLEDKNYSKLQLSIQTQDFCPILNKHYQLLAKSEFGINKDYNCVFAPIDTPTEKERAEIKEINSRCDMNYIQAGVISPDEVRGVLREDENSGYSALSEEQEGEENPFDDFGGSGFADGGSENAQSPFSQDEEPEKWITTKTKAHIPIYKGQTKKEAIENYGDKKQKLKEPENKPEIIKETQKAYLLQKEGKQFWVQKKWLREDGTLTPAGQKSFENAPTLEEVEKQKEKYKKGQVPPHPNWESEKALGYDILLEFPNLEKTRRHRLFIPKSVLMDNGNIPFWILEKKVAELDREYANWGGWRIENHPFDINFGSRDWSNLTSEDDQIQTHDNRIYSIFNGNSCVSEDGENFVFCADTKINVKAQDFVEDYRSGTGGVTEERLKKQIEYWADKPKALDEWKESDHPRKQNGQFGKGGGNSNNSKEEKEKLPNVYKINNKEYKQIDLPYSEWKKVDSAIRTNFPNKKNGMLKKGVFPYVYTIIFKKGDFIIVDKVDSENDIYN